MKAAVDDYHKLADGNAVCDYSFHVIVTDPSKQQMHEELVGLMDEGITSIKIYSTYPALKLNDTQILDTFYAARQHGVTVSTCQGDYASEFLLIFTRLQWYMPKTATSSSGSRKISKPEA